MSLRARHGIGLVVLAGVFFTKSGGTVVLGQCSPPILGAVQGNSTSDMVSLSADGRYMAFSSTASNLVPLDTNGASDVFVYDRLSCAVERVSITTAELQANGASIFPTISDNGQYVAFASLATNLLGAPNEPADDYDIFVRDRVGGTTIRVSNNSLGVKGNSHSQFPVISGDGSAVTYLSQASNLDTVTADTNGNADTFVSSGGITTRVSVTSAGVQGTSPFQGVETWRGGISNDGRYVVFSTIYALVADDTNGLNDVYIRDRQASTTSRVSVRSNGTQVMGNAFHAAISGDGRYVAFDGDANDLVPGDTNFVNDVFVHDMVTGATTRASVANQSGAQVTGSHSGYPSLSGDGRYVAFTGGSNDFVIGDDNGHNDIFVHDLVTHVVKRASATPAGVQSNNSSNYPDISDNGLFVGFQSNATNLGANPDPNGFFEDAFNSNWRFISDPPDVNLMRNGTFGSGVANWQPFALPDSSFIDFNTTGGVLQFNRLPGSVQAVVLQGITAQLQPGSPIVATFQLGNSSTARRRISVLIHDEDFSDLSVCTFWLPAGAALQTYTMRTHTTESWTGATIAFYAAVEGVDGGFNRIDNVTFTFAPAQADDETVCVDPLTPTAPGGVAGSELLINGDFSSGQAPWQDVFQITKQISGGVFEFFRPSANPNPAGVILQSTGITANPGEVFTARFDLGNSSGVRKRVTVLLHDSDFLDLSACTFWLAPGQALSSYLMRSYTTKSWANATFSVYAATVGDDQWIRLDNASLKKTPGDQPVGTQCGEPGSSLASINVPDGSPAASSAAASDAAALAGAPQAAGSRSRPAASARWFASGPIALSSDTVAIDLRDSAQTLLSFQSYLAGDVPGSIQISSDGRSWMTVAELHGSDDWTPVVLDLSEFAGEIARVRFVLEPSSAEVRRSRWLIHDLRVER